MQLVIGINSLLTWGVELDVSLSLILLLLLLLLLLALRLSWIDIGKGRGRHLHFGLDFVGLIIFVRIFFDDSQSCLALDHQLGFCLGQLLRFALVAAALCLQVSGLNARPQHGADENSEIDTHYGDNGKSEVGLDFH